MARRDNANEYSLFLNLVSDEERADNALALAKIQAGSFEGVAQQAHAVLQALLAGKLPPAIAQEARGLLEVQMMAAAAADRRDNPQKPNEGMSVTLNLLSALENAEPQFEAKYDRFDAIDIEPSPPQTIATSSQGLVVDGIEDIEDLS